MSQAESILDALGGWKNVTNVEACITRIRVDVNDDEKVNEDALKAAGAFGVVTVGNSIQIVMGPQADAIVHDIESLR